MYLNTDEKACEEDDKGENKFPRPERRNSDVSKNLVQEKHSLPSPLRLAVEDRLYVIRQPLVILDNLKFIQTINELLRNFSMTSCVNHARNPLLLHHLRNVGCLLVLHLPPRPPLLASRHLRQRERPPLSFLLNLSSFPCSTSFSLLSSPCILFAHVSILSIRPGKKFPARLFDERFSARIDRPVHPPLACRRIDLLISVVLLLVPPPRLHPLLRQPHDGPVLAPSHDTL
mmetsp:Transcript_26495/g.60349  ORF Transcript_26495/g.60349 Transcript_26495/m.60349 type:complete len:230 (-) Transcript_26495:463-1152(-)